MGSGQIAVGRRSSALRMGGPPANRRWPSVTRRGWAILALGVILYFFANQTQVSWLYVFTALTLALWLVSAVVPGRTLRALSLARCLDDGADSGDWRVGQAATVELELRNPASAPALQVRGQELCPFASADERAQNFFVSVPARGGVTLRYAVTCTRRGWFEFPPVVLTTRAPFGFFAARRSALAPAGVLIFPEYRVLKQFPLLDRRPATHNPFAQVGQGSEFIGVREYRTGDSPRHVHWRSTARAGQLVVKEFAEETQPGLTLALDVGSASVLGGDEDNTLERAIKVAATLAHYADERGLPVTLATNSYAWPAPPGPLSRWAAMNYLARVQADGEQPFADCLRGLSAAVFVAALLPAPDETASAPLIELKNQGVEVLAVLIDPAPFASEQVGRAGALAERLRAGGVSVRVIGAEPDWERTLVADDRAAPRW